MCEE